MYLQSSRSYARHFGMTGWKKQGIYLSLKDLIVTEKRMLRNCVTCMHGVWALRREQSFLTEVTRGRRWDIRVQPHGKHQRSERACCVGRTTCHVLLLEHEVYGRVLGEVLDAGREHLDSLLKGVVSHRSTFHLTCQYFAAPLLCTPYAFVVFCLQQR